MEQVSCMDYYVPPIYEKTYTKFDGKNCVDFVDDVLFFAELYEKELEAHLKEWYLPLIEGMGRFSWKTHYDFKLRINSGAKHNKNHNSTKQRLLHRSGRKLEKKIAFLNFKSDGNYNISKYLGNNKNFHRS